MRPFFTSLRRVKIGGYLDLYHHINFTRVCHPVQRELPANSSSVEQSFGARMSIRRYILNDGRVYVLVSEVYDYVRLFQSFFRDGLGR